MLHLPRSLVRIGFPVALALAGCAATAKVDDSELATEPAPSDPVHASVPSSPSQQSGSSDPGDTGGSGTAKDGGSTTKEAGAKPDSSTPPPPPPPPAICINEAGAPLVAQTPCGCDKDCAPSLVCGTVGGLLEPWCCAKAATACSDNNDCCGNLLCDSGFCK